MANPVFWNAAGSEPKRQHRFLVSIGGLKARGDDKFVDYLVRTIKTPAYSVSETEHKFLGGTYYYPGTVNWEEVTMTIVNSLQPDGNRILYDALLQSGYLLPREQGDAGVGPKINDGTAGTVAKSQAQAALGLVKIRELNGIGHVVGTWSLANCWVKSASFGDLDYSGDELLNIDITLRYDWADYATGVANAQATGKRGIGEGSAAGTQALPGVGTAGS